MRVRLWTLWEGEISSGSCSGISSGTGLVRVGLQPELKLVGEREREKGEGKGTEGKEGVREGGRE